jgi:ubiquinone/menaquinone biosynthesis C-methylase UbiE
MDGDRMEQHNENTKDWFQEWANEYDETLGKVDRHHEMLDLAVQLSEVQPESQVLDIGCGTGLLSLKFLKMAACNITAIDSSTQMLSIFKEKVAKYKLIDRVQCIQCSVEDMKFESNQFDIVAATVALHHVQEKQPVLENIFSVLKSGGKFIIGDIDMDTTGDLSDPQRLLRILPYLHEECVLAMKDGGIKAFERMYDNGKKHVLNDGEYCIDFGQWEQLCEKSGFNRIETHPVRLFEWLKVLVAIK